ncbi:MAG: outer membrane beta-barrel domain-containing protein [Myxococcota bacterium]|nr:outer membrane beta-barrel domain-containing protein [Myxococcota bacterium]
MKHPVRLLALLIACVLLTPALGHAAKRKTRKTNTDETRDVKVEEVGVLRNEDVRVVQKNLFVKKGFHEVGFLISTQPWDNYVGGVMGGLNVTLNPTEKFGFEFAVQGGYGWGTGHWNDVTFLGAAAGGQLTSLGSDSSRQLVGGSANLVWSPIYAKLAWGARKVLHFDVYATLGGHGFLGQRLEADGGLRAIVGPSVGIGLKFFINQKVAFKVDLRDHISLEMRTYTQKFTARNNFQFAIGFAFYPERS